MKNFFSGQIKHLDDNDLVLLYLASKTELKARDLLRMVNKAIEIGDPSISNSSIKPSLSKKKIKQQCFDNGNPIIFHFLSEDWSDLFKGTYDDEKKYYVYYHSDPKVKSVTFSNGIEDLVFNGKPFYVGKGVGNRIFSKTRSRPHLNVLKNLESVYPKKFIYHKFKDNLTELEALELEAKLINFFGCEVELSLENIHFHGYKGGWLINSDPAIRPQYVSVIIKQKGRFSTKKIYQKKA